MMGNAPERIWATMMDPDCARSGTFVDCAEYPAKPNADAVQYMVVDLAPAPSWQPIETAPRGVEVDGRPGVAWMTLAIPDSEGGHHVCDGMRIGNSFFACLTYYSGGPFNEKQYEQREAKVIPSHWKPKSPPPEAD